MTARHPRLRPLSRDHHGALVHARRLRRAADSGRADDLRAAVEAFARDVDEIRDHFGAEEQYLIPLLTAELTARLRAEHADLHRGMDRLEASVAADGEPATPEEARSFGEALAAHVRWEEGELFPHIEQTASPEQLAALTEPMLALEARRDRPDRIREADAEADD